MGNGKPYKIPRKAIWTAYKRVKANKGSAGIDEVDFENYEKHLKDNLYKLWNRMSSGSYHPAAVKAVEIPKKSGGTRRLGIPTTDDRIAQMTAKLYVEPKIDPIFLEDSYGYRPGKSAIEAVGQARKRCWKYDYVIDLDIKGLFDNIDHELLMKAVCEKSNRFPGNYHTPIPGMIKLINDTKSILIHSCLNYLSSILRKQVKEFPLYGACSVLELQKQY